MKQTIPFFLCLILLVGCRTQDTATVIPQLPPADTLRSQRIAMPSSVFLNPTNMCVTGDKLIVYSEGKDTLFDIFGLPDCNWLARGGLTGKGPQDFSLLERSLMLPIDSGFTVSMFDKLVDVSIAENRIRIIRSRPLFNASATHLFTNRLRPINDSMCFYINDAMAEVVPQEFTLLNLNTLSSTKLSSWPSHWITGEIVPKAETSVFISNPVARPDGKRFAIFYVLFKRLRIFESDGTLLNDISVEEPPFGNQFTSDYSIPYRYYYDYPQATQDHIYVPCINSTSWRDKPALEIQVWDWNGTPIARYILDQNIFLIALPTPADKLYAMDYDGQLYIYTLPKLSHNNT